MSIIKGTTKWIAIHVSSGNIILTRNIMQRSIKNSMKIRANQFSQSIIIKKSKNLFTECSKEQTSY